MLARYAALVAKVDAFVERVESRYRDEMPCAAGCDRCCHVRLTITPVEAAAIDAWASALAPDVRRALADAARRGAPDDDRCAALDDSGRCRIYAARPLVCRSHGVPIRQRDHRHLPVIHSCELTFRTRSPAEVTSDCVLDQELVSTTLGLIDRAFAAESGADTRRVALREVLIGLRPPE